MGDMGPLPWQGLNTLFSEKVVIRQSSSQCPGLSVCAVIGLKVNPKGNYPPLSSTFVWDCFLCCPWTTLFQLSFESICAQLSRLYFLLLLFFLSMVLSFDRSYGSVFKAMHKETGQVVAIKQVPVDTDLQEIIKEISMMQQCDRYMI